MTARQIMRPGHQIPLSGMLAIVDNPKADMFRIVDDALAHLEAGLPLDWTPGKRR